MNWLRKRRIQRLRWIVWSMAFERAMDTNDPISSAQIASEALQTFVNDVERGL